MRFNTILTDYETAAMLDGSDRDWGRDAAGLFEYIKGHATGAYSEQIGRGVNAVQLTTIHQAKGLEWPVGFMPSLVEAIGLQGPLAPGGDHSRSHRKAEAGYDRQGDLRWREV
jgi:superfamily I DNA/RNA helicase